MKLLALKHVFYSYSLIGQFLGLVDLNLTRDGIKTLAL